MPQDPPPHTHTLGNVFSSPYLEPLLYNPASAPGLVQFQKVFNQTTREVEVLLRITVIGRALMWSLNSSNSNSKFIITPFIIWRKKITNVPV